MDLSSAGIWESADGTSVTCLVCGNGKSFSRNSVRKHLQTQAHERAVLMRTAVQKQAEQLCFYIIITAGVLAFGAGWLDANFALMMKVKLSIRPLSWSNRRIRPFLAKSSFIHERTGLDLVICRSIWSHEFSLRPDCLLCKFSANLLCTGVPIPC